MKASAGKRLRIPGRRRNTNLARRRKREAEQVFPATFVPFPCCQKRRHRSARDRALGRRKWLRRFRGPRRFECKWAGRARRKCCLPEPGPPKRHPETLDQSERLERGRRGWAG